MAEQRIFITVSELNRLFDIETRHYMLLDAIFDTATLTYNNSDLMFNEPSIRSAVKIIEREYYDYAVKEKALIEELNREGK